MTANQFHNRLLDIVRPGGPGPLSWSSESDFPLSVVRLTDAQVVLWLPLMERTATGWQAKSVETLLRSQGETGRWQELLRLLRTPGIPARVYRRPTGEPAEYALFLICRVGGEWVGVKTLTIET